MRGWVGEDYTDYLNQFCKNAVCILIDRIALTTEPATTRLAYAIGRSMQNRNTIRRSKNSFYNVNKGTIHHEISQYLMQKLPADMMQALKEYYKKPFYEKDEWWG